MDLERWNTQTRSYQENLIEYDDPKRKPNYPKGFFEKFSKSNTKTKINLSEDDGWSRDGFYSRGAGGINNPTSFDTSWSDQGFKVTSNSQRTRQYGVWTRI